ncbi:MAG: hypothetical protein COW01_01640 [Bdellovibrionales bacterium CG12_big_fil_rev_8_21_14_0_65_38_15]|nr:MAG: hypothetical protein COW79_00190 [Bdellovibrionales bacterium CG22_combo_CG10-13_8_21_14_all_38_13]PIQ57174.1 MAG: hypothetical protein COW01_01640 [Bdellovibrionales bacterium CG12_big_fil_rev_8_21_14_0_65_38_15]PIR31368.1 MAG: hypothetical protein COV38_00730 [Bdellovibrionales bacterium CG11_big_fil_rev_8_21_14_0_20_38_13]
MLKKIRNIFNYNFSLHFRFLFNVNAKRIRFLGPFEFNVDKNSIISSTNNSACFIGSPIGATGRKSLITQIKLKKNSKLILGENSIIGSGCTVSCNSNAIISIGKNSYIASTSILSSSQSVTIGENCSISWNVTIMDDDGHTFRNHKQVKAITIGNNVWIGANSIILKGVNLGDNVVVGTGSVVTKSFPNNSVIAGVPAKLIKTITD